MWEITRLRSFRNKPTHVGRKLSINMSPPLPPPTCDKNAQTPPHAYLGGGNRYRAAAGDNTRNSNIKRPLTHTHTPAPPLSTCYTLHLPVMMTVAYPIVLVPNFCKSSISDHMYLQYVGRDISDCFCLLFASKSAQALVGKGREKGETARRP